MILWLKTLFGMHIHYWGVPHLNRAGALIQTCYDCSHSRPVKAPLIPES